MLDIIRKSAIPFCPFIGGFLGLSIIIVDIQHLNDLE